MQRSKRDSQLQAFESLDEMLGCIRQIESVLLRFKELEGLMREDPAGELIGSLIDKAELEVAQAKRRLIQ